MSTRRIPVYRKDPNAKKDYAVDWSSWLQDGETISSSAWAIDVTPDGTLVISGSPAASNTSTVATVWLEAGSAGRQYRVRNRITTSAGRTDDQSLDIYVAEQ